MIGLAKSWACATGVCGEHTREALAVSRVEKSRETARSVNSLVQTRPRRGQITRASVLERRVTTRTRYLHHLWMTDRLSNFSPMAPALATLVREAGHMSYASKGRNARDLAANARRPTTAWSCSEPSKACDNSSGHAASDW